MKTTIAYALALVALLNGFQAQAIHASGVHDASPYKRLLRIRSVEEGESPKTQVCVPDSTKMDDMNCNNCFCVADGSGWACTDMLCPSDESKVPDPEDAGDVQADESQRVRRELNDSLFACLPNSVTIMGCIICSCSPEGRSECTRMSCTRHDDVPFQASDPFSD